MDLVLINTPPQFLVIEMIIFDINSLILAELKVINNVRRVDGVHDNIILYSTNHGQFERGLERERGEQNGVVGEFGREEFGVEKLLAFGEDGGELADSALELAQSVVAAYSNRVLLPAPLDAQR